MRTSISILLFFIAHFCFANEAENNCLDGLYEFSVEIPVTLKNAEERAAVKVDLLAAFAGNEADSLLIQGILDQNWVDSSYQKGLDQLIERTSKNLQGQLNLFERLELEQQFGIVNANLGLNNKSTFDTKKIHIAGLTAEKLLFARCQALGKNKMPLQMPEKISTTLLAFSSLMSIIGLLAGLFAFYKKWQAKKA